ncbi:hypothetical protein GO755_03470 [Spirosoma sp. HMF4905]|uniref:Fibronectin type-III domain-containing protein n=1 Tax=Spirosoma arboris TaxID=2682092 RepID=A0A7K1S630_9BACT|nr:fibronectin type III domain-containing protein [Spirosoma arboris]MVM29078.1 hypothetical protein [Spirosoma arboris]
MNVRYLLSLLIGYCLSCTSVYADCQIPQATYTYTITHQSASLSWSYYGGSFPSYQVQWRISGSATWTTNPVLTTTGTSLTGLTNNTTYEWRVRSICAAGDTSAYTSTQAFQTKCDPPSSLYIANVTHESAQLYWYVPTNGLTYEVQWRPVGAATWNTVSGLTGNSLNLSGLADETSYEWKVRTTCSASAASDVVNGPIIQTHCLPPSNTRLTLANPEAVELKWDGPQANVLFDLQWRPAGASNWTLVEGISLPEYVLTGLTNSTTYEWQVRTACSAASKSAFSDIKQFDTSCPLPVYLSSSSITYNSAVLEWRAASSELQWREAGAADWNTVPSAKSPYSLIGLANNTSYVWRVRTVCSASATSGYTPLQLISTQCRAPMNARSYPNATGGLELYWDTSDGGPFEVQWRATGTTNWSSVAGIPSASYILTGLAPETVYEWRVRKVCSTTEYSAFATAQPVLITCSVPTYTQSTNGTNTTIDLSWSAGETSARYELQWRAVNTSSWTTISGINSVSYKLTGLQASVPYEWRVRKQCSDQVASDFTASQTFTLSCSQPTYFYTNTLTNSSAIIGWYGTATYPPYELQYRLAGATDWTLLSGLTTPSYSFTGLSNNITYEWRVRSACSGAGASDFSAIQTFHTQCGPALSGLTIGAIDVNSARLIWQNNTSTGLYEIQYRDVAGGDWIVIRPEGSETDPYFGIPGYGNKQYTLYGLTLGKTYAWRVRMICATSIYSDFVDGPTFTTACSIPQGIYWYQQTNTSAAISWNYSSAASSYDLQWRAIDASTWNTINGLTNTSYVLTNLIPGTMYQARVRQQCLTGAVSDFSGSATTFVQCIIPSITTNIPLSSSSAQLTWMYYTTNGNDAATVAHELQYRISGTSDWTQVTGILGTTYSLTGLTAGASYEWRVRAICSQNVVSDFSGTSTFGLICPVPYVYGYNTQTSATAARLFWDNSSSSQSYVLRWRIVGTTVWSSLAVATSTYSLTGLTNNTTYEWQVAADCGGYLSDFSTIQSFQTSCPSVYSMFLSVGSVGAASAQLNWNGSNQFPGLTYTLQYRISGTVIWSEINGLTSTSTSLTGLASKTMYEWRVRPICESGAASAFALGSTFVTQCSSPYSYYVDGTTTQSVSIIWRPNPDNVYVNLQWRQINSSAPWNAVNGLTSSVYSLTGLTPGTSYEYRLQGVCSANDQGQSSGYTFMTLPVNSTTFSIYSDSVSYQSIRLNWTGPSDRTNYILQWRESGGNWTSTGPLSTRKYLLTGLTTGTTYDIRVSYVDDNAVTYEATMYVTMYCPRISSASTAAITTTSAQLNWTPVNAPVLVQWRVAGTTLWSSATGVTGSSYSLTGLTNNTVYEWRLQTVCSSNAVNVTYPISFRTGCLLPVSLFTQNVTTQSARLSWSGSASQYSIQYRIVGTPNWTTVTGITSTTYALIGLVTNTTYEWAVSATCGATISSIYTSPIRFTTACSLPYYVYVNASASDRAQFSWDGAESTYQLQWRAVGATAWNTIPAVTSPYTLTGLTTGTTYEARIRAACAVAANGPFLPINSFTPQCVPEYYYNEYKSTTNITAGTARLNWEFNPVLTYSLRWRIVGSNSWTNVPGYVTSPYTLSGLTNNTTYEWQLHTACEPTNYASSQVFQTTCAMPGGLWSESLSATSVKLHWNSSGEGVPYELQWRAFGTSVWTTVSGITNTNYVLTGLEFSSTYEWQVRSQCVGSSPFQLTVLFKLADDCSLSIYTIREGSWDDPTVWSCNRIPTLTDQVKLNHKLVIPNAYVAKALSIRYETGARLTLGAGSSVKVGN